MADYEYGPDALRVQFENVRNTRQGLELVWDLVLRMVQPNYRLNNYFNTVASQPKLNEGYDLNILRNLYHNRGAVNSGILASYLHSNLTNPHAQWMKITLPEIKFLSGMISDEKLEDLKGLQLIGQECHTTWQDSNFHAMMYPFYKSLVDVGTACLVRYVVNQGGRKELSFGHRSMFNVFFLEDAYSRPSHVFCSYNWSAYQIKDYFYPKLSDEKFREKMPQKIYDSYMKRDLTSWHIVHSVYPKTENSYKSCYFFYEQQPAGSMDDRGQDFLREEILPYQPYSISRIRKNPESAYGTGFSMEAYPLLASLQKAQKNLWLAVDKNVNPPMNAPTERLRGEYSTSPNEFNTMETLNGKLVGLEPAIPPVNVSQLTENKMDLLRDIDQTYMIDKILMENVKYNRSATEVQKRTGEEIKLLSPFIGSLESEFLKPLVDMTLRFFAKNRQGLEVEKALTRLAKKPYKLQYISPIAQVQVKKEVMNMLEFYGYSNALSQKDKRIDIRQDWLLFWEKLAVLSNAPFDTFKMKKTYDQGIKDIEAQNKKMEQQSTVEDLSKTGSFYKDVMEGEKTKREFVQ